MRISDWSSDWCSSDLRAQFDIAVLAPDAVEQLPAREDAARMLHEMAEQAEFGRPHRDDLARPHHLVRDRIEFDVGIAQHLAGERGAQAAEHGLAARDQLARAERLGDIIVRAGLEPAATLEERRVGKECVRTCRSWGAPDH